MDGVTRVRTATPLPRPRPGGEPRRLVSPTLIGRDESVRALLDAVAAAPSLVVIEGEAGVGKSRLVAELLSRPELAGRSRLVGRCQPIRETFPLGALIEAVRSMGPELADPASPADLRPGPVAGALRPLLPELAEWLPPQLEALEDRQAERHRVFRAIREVLRASASVRPVVLVLEDLQWVDGQTLDFLRYWLADPGTGVSLVLTYRTEDAGAELRGLTARLPAGLAHDHLVLEPLDEAGTGALLAAILDAGRVSEEFGRHLWERTGGLPLAVEEVLALVLARGMVTHGERGWVRRTLSELEVPRGIREPTLQRVARLSGAGQEVAQAAAVLQVAAPPEVLLHTAFGAGPGREPRSAEHLEEVLESGLLVEDGDDVRFRHVLAAEAVEAALNGPRRRELHRRAAAAVRTTAPGALGRVAHHLRSAGDVDEWVAAAEAAADDAVRRSHDEEACRLLTDVLQTAALDPDLRIRLCLKLGRAATATLGSTAVVELLTGALAIAPAGAARGELRYLLTAALNKGGGDVGDQRDLLLGAVSDLKDSPALKARTMVALGIVSPPNVPVAEDISWVVQALDTVSGLEDRQLETFVLGKAGTVLAQSGDPAWRAVTEQLLDLTARAPALMAEANAYYSIALPACYAGHLSVATQLVDLASASPAVHDNWRLEVLLRAARALVLFASGQWLGLRAETDSLRDELEGHALGRAAVQLISGHLAVAAGDLDEAEDLLGAAIEVARDNELYDMLPLALAGGIRVAMATGRRELVLGRLELLESSLAGKGVWAPACWAIPAAVDAWADMGAPDEARRFVALARRGLAGLDAPLARAVLGYADGVLGDPAEGGALLLDAAAGFDAALVPYESARSVERAADLLLTGGRVQEGEASLRSALGTYRELGATRDEDRAVALGRAHGISATRRHGGGRRAYPGLSPREEQVAALAARGLTNAQIALELFVSRKTVDKHMSAAMRKLAVSSRTALAMRLVEDAGTKDGEVLP